MTVMMMMIHGTSGCVRIYTASVQKDNDSTAPWSRAAPYWDKHRETIRRMFAPVTQALIEDARIGHGQTVLDVATGPGEPALRIAEFIESAGSVFGIDPSPVMIAAARRAADRRRLD